MIAHESTATAITSGRRPRRVTRASLLACKPQTVLKARSLMHGWLAQDLKISAWVLLPIAFGVLLSRWGVSKRAASGLFAFAFYGCQTAVTVCAIWVARIQAEAGILPLLALSGWLITAALAWPISRKLGDQYARRGAFVVSM